MKLAHTMIRVKDLDATLDFYTDFIGLTEVRRKEIGDEATLILNPLPGTLGGYLVTVSIISWTVNSLTRRDRVQEPRG